MLKIEGEATWADFNCTEVELKALENMNIYDIFDAPQSKMVCIAHCLCAMLRKLGITKVTEYVNVRGFTKEDNTYTHTLEDLDLYEHLSECSHGRLREIIKFLIDAFPRSFTQTPVNENSISYNHCGND